MRVAIVTIGEPLPFQGPDTRLYRAGLLAEALVAAGHEVTWWTSAFNHFNRQFHGEPAVRSMGPNYEIRLLKGRGYKRNISYRRYRDHLDLARELALALPSAPVPDVIFCSIPVAEHAKVMQDFAIPRGIPTVLDARDMWPDLFLDFVPLPMAPFAKLALSNMFRVTEEVFRDATSLIAHTSALLEWSLEYADREMRGGDRVFPFGYKSTMPDEASLVAARAKWDERGVHAGVPRIVFTGQPNNQIDFTQTWEVARQFPQLQVVICGSSEDQTILSRMAGGLPNVMLSGWVGMAELRTLLERTTAGLMPYVPKYRFMCAMPNKANEYLANSLPIIWSIEYGELADTIRNHDCGGIYDPATPGSLAKVVGDMLESPGEWRAKGQRGHAVFESSLRAEVIYPQLVDFLEELASKRYP